MHKIRAEITKDEEIRYISHLDYASAVERAIRRAKLPVAYSEGFNPHMKISFASALAVGVTSASEYMDVEFKEFVAVDAFIAVMKRNLPVGIRLLQAKEIIEKQPALMAIVDLADYIVEVPFCGNFKAVEKAVAEYNCSPEVYYLRKTPKSKKEIETKQYMNEPVMVQLDDNKIEFSIVIKITPSGSIKPGEVIKVMIEKFDLPINQNDILIHRKGLYSQGKTPIER